MARINIEDDLQEDPRFHTLEESVGKVMALGIVAHAFKMAQFFWTKKDAPRSLVPKKLFLRCPEMQNLLDCELAYEKEEGFIYVCGSKDRFAWIEQKREAGRVGGKKSGEARRSRPEAELSETKQEPTTPQAEGSETKPLTPVPVPALAPTLVHSLHTQGGSQKFSQNDLITMFNKICAGNGKVRTFSGYDLPREAFENFFNRSGRPEWQSPDNWENFFMEVASSDYLCGKKERKGFVVTLPWILKPDNFENIIGGLYGNRTEEEKRTKEDSVQLGAMSDKLFEQIIRNGRYAFTKTDYSPTELKAIEIIGGLAVIFDCTNFTMDKVKAQLRAAYKQAMGESSD